jgi:hypothetical protein
VAFKLLKVPLALPDLLLIVCNDSSISCKESRCICILWEVREGMVTGGGGSALEVVVDNGEDDPENDGPPSCPIDMVDMGDDGDTGKVPFKSWEEEDEDTEGVVGNDTVCNGDNEEAGSSPAPCSDGLEGDAS